MTRFTVRHETHYDYGTPVDLGFHLLRLTPLTLPRQRLLEHSLSITPDPIGLRKYIDHFGNAVHYVMIESTHERFSVTLDATVEVVDRHAPADDGPPWEAIRDAMRSDGFPDVAATTEFVYPSPLAAQDDGVAAYVAESFADRRPIVPALRDLMARIHDDFAYAPNSTSISTQVSEIIQMRRGVCQDFAHVMIAGLRGLGLPARYVSGYIRTVPGASDVPVRGLDASHAWVSVWCGDDIGWVEFDPTNDLVVKDQHVAVAYGRDFSDVTPLRGVILGGSKHTLSVAVSVTAVNPGTETPVGDMRRDAIIETP